MAQGWCDRWGKGMRNMEKERDSFIHSFIYFIHSFISFPSFIHSFHSSIHFISSHSFIHSFISFIHSTLWLGFKPHVLVNHLDVNYFGVWLVGWPVGQASPKTKTNLMFAFCLERTTTNNKFLVPFLFELGGFLFRVFFHWRCVLGFSIFFSTWFLHSQ
jgi:hypothetical protein